MYSFTFTLTPQFLEAVNGVLLVIYLSILFFFGKYIYGGIREMGWKVGRRQRRGAISVSVLLIGDFLILLSIWVVRHMQNSHGWSSQNSETVATVGTTVGVVFAIVGGVCILRSFAPVRLGEWPSVLTVLIAIAFGVGMAL